MNWCFVYKNYITGGLETFVLRMANYLVNNGHSVFLVCQTVSDEMKTQFIDAGAIIECFDRWNRKIISDSLRNKADIFISFSLSDYYLIGKFAKYALSLIYCVHPTHLIMDDRKMNLIEILKKPVFYQIIKRGIKNNTLLMMDENISDAIYKKYKLKVKPSEILQLPYEPASKVKIWNETLEKTYSVLTICRADFPFKSYVLGLVDAIASINKNNIVAKLTIVSYGKDLDVIKGKIKGKNYIKLIQETKYNDLENLYLGSDIYVGMGSTAIEASNYGLPVILANVNNDKFVSCGYFYENPTQKGIFKNNAKPGICYLNPLIDYDYSQLKEMGQKNKSAFHDLYDIKSFTQSIMRIYHDLIQ